MRSSKFAALGIAAIVGIASSPARAYDWNAKTVTNELDVLDGRMAIESGHPLATARAFRLAEQLAAQDQTGADDAAMVFVYGPDYIDDRSDALQTVVFGSWLNEVRTSLDMGGSGGLFDPLGWAARFMAWRYGDYLDGRERSDRWSESTGYASSNFQHSMMVTSIDPAETITQDDVFDLLDEYSFWAINAAVLNLIVAKKGEVEGSMTAEEIDLNWVAGLRYVGSVFHLVEDSSVTCSDEAQALVPVCVPGDGHTIVQPVDGRLQVVALSDNVYYERNVEGGEKPHGALDGLHQAALVEQVYGAFDPALATSRILVLVAAGVDRAVHEDLAAIPLFVNGEPNAEFDAAAFSISSAIANEIFDEVIDPRFADAGDRITLPPLSRSDDDKSDDPAEEGDDAESSGCRVVDETPAGTPWLLAVVALAARRRRDTTP